MSSLHVSCLNFNTNLSYRLSRVSFRLSCVSFRLSRFRIVCRTFHIVCCLLILTYLDCTSTPTFRFVCRAFRFVCRAFRFVCRAFVSFVVLFHIVCRTCLLCVSFVVSFVSFVVSFVSFVVTLSNSKYNNKIR